MRLLLLALQQEYERHCNDPPGLTRRATMRLDRVCGPSNIGVAQYITTSQTSLSHARSSPSRPFSPSASFKTNSYTFSKIQDNTDKHWSFQRYHLTREYHDRPLIAPPLILMVHVYLLVRKFAKCCCQIKDKNAFRKYT